MINRIDGRISARSKHAVYALQANPILLPDNWDRIDQAVTEDRAADYLR